MVMWITALIELRGLFDAVRGHVSKADHIILWWSVGLRCTILPFKVIHWRRFTRCDVTRRRRRRTVTWRNDDDNNALPPCCAWWHL